MASQRVLAVDDEQTIVQLLRFLLEDAGYEVVTASTCAQARTLFSQQFHVVILDKNLPDGSGLDLGAELRRLDPFCETVLLTGYSTKESAIEAVNAGFYAYCEKPIEDLARFVMTVRQAVQKAELQRRQVKTERLIEQMRKTDALGRLASGVAHDFNNVLAVIGMTAEVLTQDDLTLEEVRKHAAELQEVVNTGRSLARQLVVFGRAGHTAAKPVVVNDTVQGMLAILQSVASHRTLEIALDEDLKPIIADADLLSQVILNLVVNAAHATKLGGKIKVATKNSKASDGKTQIVLSVEDDGCGMSPEVQSHLFEPYFTTKGDGLGTGLGLATVLNVAHKHGGRVEVHSQDGHGSRFDVYLPAGD